MNLDCSSLTLDQTVGILCQRVAALLSQQAATPRQRTLIALAGVPGSGKSTLSGALMQTLSAQNAENITVVPMDGFHYPKAVLAKFPDPNLAFSRRGAPFTYDAAAFLRLVAELKIQPLTLPDEPEIIIRAPGFNHEVQDPVADAFEISSRTKIVIIEGNYTLFDEPPWNKVAQEVDERWLVDISPEVAKERLVNRHLRAGIESSRELAVRRVENNDFANADLIRKKLIKPNVTIMC